MMSEFMNECVREMALRRTLYVQYVCVGVRSGNVS